MNKLLRKIKLWWKTRKILKEIDREVDVYYSNSSNEYLIHVNQEENKLQEGIRVVKSVVRSKIESLPKEEQEKVLEKCGDLVRFARKEGAAQKALRELRENVFVTKEKDVKSSRDKKKMIDKRIADYYDLHEHKRKRELVRQMRNETDPQKYEELKKEFEEKYSNGFK